MDSFRLSIISDNFDFLLVDGILTQWTSWSECSFSCGNGTEFRIRRCNFPAGAPKGQNCTGALQETKWCNNGSCPGTSNSLLCSTYKNESSDICAD